MTTPASEPGQPAVVFDGGLAFCSSPSTFTLAGSHPMRSAGCAICHQPAGGSPVTIASIAGLGGDSCVNGCVTSWSWILHASCLPAEQDVLSGALILGLACPCSHPWE